MEVELGELTLAAGVPAHSTRNRFIEQREAQLEALGLGPAVVVVWIASGMPAAGVQAPERSPLTAPIRPTGRRCEWHGPSIVGGPLCRNRGDHDGNRGFPAPTASAPALVSHVR
jgi:hypothetical protein